MKKQTRQIETPRVTEASAQEVSEYSVPAREAPTKCACSLTRERVLLNAAEAAAMLGISRTALYQRVYQHQVGGIVRVGRRLHFHRERLLAWVERKVVR